METIRRRTDGSANPLGVQTAKTLIGGGDTASTSRSSVSTTVPNESSTFDYSHQKDDVAANDNFNYKIEFLLLYSIPLIVLISFGGKVTLFVFCFGALLCYIFDLAGSIEGTLFTVMITAMAVFISLLWAARDFLTETWLNVSFIVLCGIVLGEVYVLLSGFFPSVQQEIGSLLLALESVMFSSSPLISSSILSWFLCAEIPSLDIVTFFSVSYFLLTRIVCRPRRIQSLGVSTKKADGSPSVDQTMHLIPLPIMKIVYVLPVIVSFAIHLAVHHNVLSTSRTRFVNTAITLLLPTLLMSVCALQQLDYWPTEQRSKVSFRLRVLVYSATGLLVLFGQDHPVFDELKSFSGLPAPVPSLLLLGSMFAGIFAVLLYRLRSKMDKHKDDSDVVDFDSPAYHRRINGYSMLLGTVISAAVGLSAWQFVLLINLPRISWMAIWIAAPGLAEIYHRKSWSLGTRLLILVFVLVETQFLALYFVESTLYHVKFDFSWTGMGLELSMDRFCRLFFVSLLLAVGVPTLVIQTAKPKDMSLLPSVGDSVGGDAHSSARGYAEQSIGFRIVEFLTPFLAFAFAAVELMIREQNWSGLEVDAETVYPSYYLIGSAILLCFTVYSLAAAKLMGYTTFWIVTVIEGSKLLHLLGFQSATLFSVALLLLAYSMPFARHISVALRIEDEKAAAHLAASSSYSAVSSFSHAYDAQSSRAESVPSLSYLELLVYVAGAAVATFLCRENVILGALSLLLDSKPTLLQTGGVGLSLFILYFSAILFVFFRRARFLRSILLIASVLILVVSCNGLGQFSFAVDPSSSFYLTVSLHPELAESDHSGMFQFISACLLLAASIGFVPLKSSFTYLVLFAILFGFTSTKASIGWAFPLSMGGSEFLSHDVHHFPFLFVFVCNFLAAVIGFFPMSALNRPVAALYKFYNTALLCAYTGFAVAPFLAAFVAFVADMFGQCIQSVAWHYIVLNAVVCLSVRWKELSVDWKRSAELSSSHAARAIMNTLSDVTLTSALLGVLWTVVLCVFSSSVDRDLAIPLSSLLLLSTSQKFEGISNIAAVACVASAWWLSSGFYSIFVSGFSADWWSANEVFSFSEFRRSSFAGTGLFPDEDVAIWTDGVSLMTVTVHFVLMFVPLPGLLLGLLYKRKEDSEEVFFVLAAASSLSIIGAQINSIRYLGIVGALSSAARCYEISAGNRQRDRLI